MWLEPAKSLEAALQDCFNNRLSDPSQAKQRAKELAQLFQLMCRGSPRTLLLCGYNVPDGTGDFSNLVSYYSWIKEVFKEVPGVHIKVFAIVSRDKIESALRVLPDNFNQKTQLYVHDINKKIYYSHLAEHREFIILCCNRNEDLSNLNKNLSKLNMEEIEKFFANTPALQQMFKRAGFLLNIATPIECTNNLFLQYIDPTCWVRSRLEYGPALSIIGFPSNDRVYFEDSMGFNRDEAGIKFNESLLEYQRLQVDNRYELITELDNTQLSGVLCRMRADDRTLELSPSQYYNQVHLGVGYLQENSTMNYTNAFLLLLASTTDKLQIDAIINISLLRLDDIAEQLKQLNVKQVIIFDENGAELGTNDVKADGNKVIRVFKFAGLTNHDVAVLYAIANVSGGSGDNSLSDVIAARSFPFIGVLAHKLDTIRALIMLIKNSGIDNNGHLSKYLEIMSQTARHSATINYDINELCQYARQHYNDIKESWSKVCDLIAEKHNAKISFNELMTEYVLIQLMCHPQYQGQFGTIARVFLQQNRLQLANEHLLHVAVIKGNLEAIKILLGLNINIDERTHRHSLNCLRLAVHLGNEELTRFFIGQNGNPNIDSSLLPPLIVEACRAEFQPDTITLLLSRMNQIAVPNQKVMISMLSAICNDAAYLNAFLSCEGSYNKNMVLYYAVCTNNVALARTAIAAGAQNETQPSRLNYWSTTLEGYRAITTKNTTVHAAILSKNKDLVRLVVENNPHYLYGERNYEQKLVTELTDDLDILEILNRKSALLCFSRISHISVRRIDNFINNEVTLTFDHIDRAWASWQFLMDHNIVCDRPNERFLSIAVDINDFEELLKNPGHKAKPISVLNEVLEMIPRIHAVLTNNHSITCRIQPHGRNGFVIYPKDEEEASRLIQVLNEACGINCRYCKKDNSIEITNIVDSNHTTVDKLNFLIRRDDMRIHFGVRLGREIKLDRLTFSGDEVTVIFNSPEDAWSAWKLLNAKNIILPRPYEEKNSLAIDKVLFHKFLLGEEIQKPAPSAELQSLLEMKIADVISKKINSRPTMIEPMGSDGLVICFANLDIAKRFYQFLDEKLLIDGRLSTRDNSIELSFGQMISFKRFVEQQSQPQAAVPVAITNRLEQRRY